MTRRSEDSGLIDLDALMREASIERPAVAVVEPPTETHPVVEATLRPPPPPLPPTVAKLSDDSLDAMTSGPDTNPGIVAPPPWPPRERMRSEANWRPAIGIAMAALVAAGALLVLRSRGQHETAVASHVAPPVDPPRAAVPVESTPSALSAADLPVAVPSASAASAPVTKQARPSDARKGTVALTDTTPPSSTEHGDLGNAMRGAVGASDAVPVATTDEPTGRSASQLRPSPGAVVGALGAVMPSARACLGPDDSIRNGLVVFKSDGSVARVELHGAKPEDDCVRLALAKAKVAPFVDDTFSTRVTVRP